MSNLRLIMKFSDGRLAWSERHWWYEGPPTGSLPPVSPTPNIANVKAQAQALVTARLNCLPSQSELLGATLSFDDAARDGSFVASQQAGLYVQITPNAVLDPELSIMCNASSALGAATYQSRFYVSPTYQQAVNDQRYIPTLYPVWTQWLNNYLGALYQNPAVTGTWGWKAAQYIAAMGAAFSATVPPSFLNVGGNFQAIIATAAVPTYIVSGQIVKVSGIQQTAGATPRLNGRWLVQGVSGSVVTLQRKRAQPWWSASTAGYIGGGTMVPQTPIILPYTYVAALQLVKKSRGGTLGLPRGRARTQRSNV